jgi:hypothetical protein
MKKTEMDELKKLLAQAVSTGADIWKEDEVLLTQNDTMVANLPKMTQWLPNSEVVSAIF